MTKFEKFLLDSGYVKHYWHVTDRTFIQEDSGVHDISPEGKKAYTYINANGQKVTFGFINDDSEPTIIDDFWAYPAKEGCKYLISRNQTKNRVLQKYNFADIITAITNPLVPLRVKDFDKLEPETAKPK